MAAGLHIVSKCKPGKPVVHYVYAWRGGPQLLRKVGGAKPETTAALTDAAAAARKVTVDVPTNTLARLIDAFTMSAEWKKLALSTQANYSTWHERILAKFGKAPFVLLVDRRLRADILEWRDGWAHQPRSADAGIGAFSALLTWGVDRGLLATNILHGVTRLYDADRSDIIWEARHFDIFRPAAPVEVLEGVDLAAATGLRRGDLVRLPWSAIGDHAIVWETSKSGGRRQITVPLLPETRQVLSRIKARHAQYMAAQRPHRRKPLPNTVLSNSYWRPWTPSGFGSRFNDAKQESGLDVNLHDLRGTFATRCMLAGLTDREIADILGWSEKDVSRIRSKYVAQSRVVVAIGERIARAKMA